MDGIVEIENNRFSYYGGNYNCYESQKLQEQKSLEHEIAVAETTIKQVKTSIQQTKEKHDQRASRGKKLRKTNSIDKLTANSKKGRSERSKSRNITLAIKMETTAQNQLSKAKEKLVIEDPVSIDLPDTYVPNGKTVIDIKDLCFGYNKDNIILDDFSMSIVGAQRIALIENNGAGKTTLLRLINNELSPISGEININVDHIGYLDQHSSNLDNNLSLLENLLQSKPTLTHQEAHSILARYKFRREIVNKKVSQLSGGEKIRANLAINLTSQNSPQLLLLDEPTNHLDLKSIKLLKQALNQYKGALIIISHDSIFLENIGINQEIKF
ncbi:ATP-binding cassette domain-containing protein [Francisella sp. 19X1-34]|uniref:ATP-binding cassette domain-containing protein n=1 Tax=Francisella sp. 19X1-34 TaxID=3087177 RepID=UPI002E36F388|nr:ATP-binding cassette domain-containing protein [Francisella sp. 19X1-34]MED7789675.1 ATP-binding cassette domain-containing protein [Francisella sp. 19X1-34]